MQSSSQPHSITQSIPKMTLSTQQQLTEANPAQQLSYPNHPCQSELQQPILQNHLPCRKGASGSNHSHGRTCKTEGHNVSATVCANCGTTTTPLWRRAPNGETICNACGLYLKARNTVRPPWLKRNTIKKASPVTPDSPDSTSGTCPGDGHCDGTGGSTSCHGCPAYNQHQVNRQALMCANCGTNTTPLWRRDEAGNTICNACGLYFKLHNVHRPVTMKRSVIKRRKRVTLATSPPPTTHHHRHHGENDHSRKNRIQHPPTPASSSGSERGYFSSEDEVCSNDSYTSSIGQKRKHAFNHTASKRQCGNSRSVPAIEDYIAINHGDKTYSADERRRSLSPVEPALNPQVQIHTNNNNNSSNGLSSGRIMGTPSIPLISAYTKNKKETNNFQSSHEASTSYAMSSSPISALLNPTSPTTSAPQLPPISSIPPPPSGHHAAQGYQAPLPAASMADPNVTQQLLQAHRQELQREVSHLSMLLNRTTAILVGLDQAMNANESQSSGPNPHSLPPLASDANATSALASLFALQNNQNTHGTPYNGNSQSTVPVSGTPVQQPYMTLPPPSGLTGLRSQSVTSDRV